MTSLCDKFSVKAEVRGSCSASVLLAQEDDVDARKSTGHVLHPYKVLEGYRN